MHSFLTPTADLTTLPPAKEGAPEGRHNAPVIAPQAQKGTPEPSPLERLPRLGRSGSIMTGLGAPAFRIPTD